MIREMSHSDYDIIRLLANNSEGIHFPSEQNEQWHCDFIKRNPGLCFVALDHDQIDGFVYVGYDGRRATIYHLTVNSNKRTSGIGSALLRKCESAISNLPIPRARLMVLSSNTHAKDFFMKRGWSKMDDYLMAKKCDL